MKRSFSIIFCLALFVVLFATNVGALSLSEYSPVIGSDEKGIGYVNQKCYPTFNDFDFYALSENTPLYNNEEEEIRITNNYMKIEVPHVVNWGLSVSNIWDGSEIAVSGGVTNYTYRYGTQIFTRDSVSTIVTAVNSADPSGVDNFRRVTVNILSTSIPSAIYAVGGCYGTIINNNVYSVDFNFPSAYRVGIKGMFYLERKDNGVMEAYGIDDVLTIYGKFSISPNLLPNEVADSYNYDEFVFSGEFYLMPIDSTSVVAPTISYWYDINDAFYAEVSDGNVGIDNRVSYSYFREPVIKYLYGADYEYDSVETIDITENGFYNVREYGYANINVPQTLEWGNMFDWIFDSIGAFMSFEIAPGWNIGVIMSIVVSLAVGIWLIRIFMGG